MYDIRDYLVFKRLGIPWFKRSDCSNFRDDMMRMVGEMDDRSLRNGGLFTMLAGLLRVVAGIAIVAALLAQAQDNRTPCARRPPFRQFDFWLGDWDVTQAGNPDRFLDAMVHLSRKIDYGPLYLCGFHPFIVACRCDSNEGSNRAAGSEIAQGIFRISHQRFDFPGFFLFH